MKRWRWLLWLALAAPAASMAQGLQSGTALPMDLLRPSGETAIRLMVLALLPGPLADVLGPRGWLRAWLAARRNIGVAAFAYAAMHLALYLVDMGSLPPVLDEIGLPGIWTGWLATALLAVPAAISFDAAMRALGRRWKRLQRWVYPAFALTLAHWLLLDWSAWPVALHAAPVALAWALRLLPLRTTFPNRPQRSLTP